jgi:hypothetical protein
MSETTAKQAEDIEGPDTCDVLMSAAREVADVCTGHGIDATASVVAAVLRTLDEFVRGAEDDDEMWPEGGDLAIIADQIDGGVSQ